ncbi:hypothetical protein Patl1_22192 [Pistacia atlantica]|uniref:Uncharacterized protein n=1 Tax=Pistacia atlantica TaxID=434234 RepID=A0ACC1BGY3_9ROSI|nr:hypothetical protein Patl1_22192 [Pistacia atlantica]
MAISAARWNIDFSLSIFYNKTQITMSTSSTKRVRIVFGINMDSPKSRSKAMSIAAGCNGVTQVTFLGVENLEVVGNGLGAVDLANLLCKKVGDAQLLFVSTDEAGAGGGGGNIHRENGGSVKIEIDICMRNLKSRSKAMSIAAGFTGVIQVTLQGEEKLEVIGIWLNAVKLANLLRKKVGDAQAVDVSTDEPGGGGGGGNIHGENGGSVNNPTAQELPPPVTTAVLKLAYHCEGCIEKIKKTLLKTKGVLSMTVDKQKELVTIQGIMDAKALAQTLKERLKRPVEIVPPKKENEEKESNVGSDDEGGDGGIEDDAENEGGGGGGGGNLSGLGYGYPYPFSGCEYGYPVVQVHAHAPQMFSDENPNACSVM